SQITDPNGNPWPYSYDPQGRLTSAADPLGRAYGYGYDERSRLTRITMPDLTQELITYDANGNVTGRSYTDGTAFTYGYDIAHRLMGITRPNGVNAAYQYDNADRMTSAVEVQPGPTQISSIQITRDALGRIGSINRLQPLMPGATMPASAPFAYDIASQVSG